MSEATCKRCDQDYTFEIGDDPTTFCNDCAHIVADELTTENAKLKEGIQEAALLIAKHVQLAKAVEKHLPSLKSLGGYQMIWVRKIVEDFEKAMS
jgi:hypothetical protein